MTVSRNEKWIRIARLDGHDRICFTRAFQKIMGELGWEAKAFVGHLLGLWHDPFEHMLDYISGQARHSQDQPGRFRSNQLGGPQEVVEYWAETWSKHDQKYRPSHEAGTGLKLDITWYRDILRAKLVSLRIPRRLLLQYKDQVLAAILELEKQVKEYDSLRQARRVRGGHASPKLRS